MADLDPAKDEHATKGETKKCPKCKEDIAKDASKCKHCNADLRNWFIRHKIVSVILGLIVIGVVTSAAGGGSTSKSGSSSNKKQETTYSVGESVNAGKTEVTITKAEERSSVGDQFLTKSPAQGGTYVAVQYTIKNTSDSPVGVFSTPSFKLVDSKGTKYSADIAASGSFATELALDQKILSDLNPGITVNGADIYEVSKEQYASGAWYVLVTADGKDYKISIK